MIKVAVIYGGMSTEHEVSKVSAKNVIENLDKNKYEVYPILIEKNGTWIENKKPIKNIVDYLSKVDVVFPVLHGSYGEDGTIQGMFEMLKIPYVGCGVLCSSICMDKVYAKYILEKAGINQADYIYLKNENTLVDDEFNEFKLENDEIAKEVEEKLGYPVFVKPSNSGSSVGISKAKNASELIKAIQIAGAEDRKVLIEKAIVGREVECAVLENEATSVGEIIPADEFYTYDAKYNNDKSKVIVPADLRKEKVEEIRKTALKVFKAVDGKGLARVDFFVEEKTEKLYLIEVNTMPGFTNISMYPKLCENYGIPYQKLLDRLIENAIKK